MPDQQQNSDLQVANQVYQSLLQLKQQMNPSAHSQQSTALSQGIGLISQPTAQGNNNSSSSDFLNKTAGSGFQMGNNPAGGNMHARNDTFSLGLGNNVNQQAVQNAMTS